MLALYVADPPGGGHSLPRTPGAATASHSEASCKCLWLLGKCSGDSVQRRGVPVFEGMWGPTSRVMRAGAPEALSELETPADTVTCSFCQPGNVSGQRSPGQGAQAQACLLASSLPMLCPAPRVQPHDCGQKPLQSSQSDCEGPTVDAPSKFEQPSWWDLSTSDYGMQGLSVGCSHRATSALPTAPGGQRHPSSVPKAGHELSRRLEPFLDPEKQPVCCPLPISVSCTYNTRFCF